METARDFPKASGSGEARLIASFLPVSPLALVQDAYLPPNEGAWTDVEACSSTLGLRCVEAISGRFAKELWDP